MRQETVSVFLTLVYPAVSVLTSIARDLGTCLIWLQPTFLVVSPSHSIWTLCFSQIKWLILPSHFIDFSVSFTNLHWSLIPPSWNCVHLFKPDSQATVSTETIPILPYTFFWRYGIQPSFHGITCVVSALLGLVYYQMTFEGRDV